MLGWCQLLERAADGPLQCGPFMLEFITFVMWIILSFFQMFSDIILVFYLLKKLTKYTSWNRISAFIRVLFLTKRISHLVEQFFDLLSKNIMTNIYYVIIYYISMHNNHGHGWYKETFFVCIFLLMSYLKITTVQLRISIISLRKIIKIIILQSIQPWKGNKIIIL